MSLREIIDAQKDKSFTSPATTSDAAALGVAMAQYFEWDGIAILETAIAALEDANFHTEAGQIADMLAKWRAE